MTTTTHSDKLLKYFEQAWSKNHCCQDCEFLVEEKDFVPYGETSVGRKYYICSCYTPNDCPYVQMRLEEDEDDE